MNPPLQFLGQDPIYHSVSLNPRFAPKRTCDNFDTEMALPVGSRPHVATMLRRFVDDLQGDGFKSCLQLGFQGFSDHS